MAESGRGVVRMRTVTMRWKLDGEERSSVGEDGVSVKPNFTTCNTEHIASGSSVAQKRVRRERDGRSYTQTLHNDLLGRNLSKQSGVITYDANCNNAPPGTSGYQPSNGFANMMIVLEHAYADAVKLASKAANVGKDSLG